MRKSKEGELTAQEIQSLFVEPNWAQRFPPILSTEQAADLLQLPVGTIYDWRSRGQLNGCCKKVGKHLRFLRDRLIAQVFGQQSNGSITNN
jgi:excisionase family DNA binding protein